MTAAAINGRIASSTVFKVSVALGLLLLVWVAADGPQIARVLAEANPIWLVLAVVLLMTQTVLSACRWRVTAGEFGQSF
ncbi:hypothetical protein [uncultured Ruegeria sp.]|uniref:hypothetical protein n=1 Tax=uncultured Ruegeria sp. TaxID=259304 RepID=UPI00262BB065|nr:hypothetical protein [uncultured Ruegeria sp.]